MLGRQIFTDNIVIRPGFQHFNAAPDTVDKPLDKLRNFAGPSCWFSALVLNDHITVTNRDSAVAVFWSICIKTPSLLLTFSRSERL